MLPVSSLHELYIILNEIHYLRTYTRVDQFIGHVIRIRDSFIDIISLNHGKFSILTIIALMKWNYFFDSITRGKWFVFIFIDRKKGVEILVRNVEMNVNEDKTAV